MSDLNDREDRNDRNGAADDVDRESGNEGADRPPTVADRVQGLIRFGVEKVFPGHPWFLLGELALFSFLVLVGTGVYLALFYEASGDPVVYTGSYEALQGLEVPAAYASVMHVTFDRPGGAWVRQTHHWSALVFMAAVVLHAGRVFFTGAFRPPRRLNWIIGITLMGLSMAAGYFGLSLPYDVLGGTGARIGHAFAVSVPVIGPGVADLLFSGEFGNPEMLRRFWILHVFVLPILIALHLGGHLLLVAFQTHTHFRHRPGDSVAKTESNVVGSRGWPGYGLKTAGLALIVIGTLFVMGAALQIAPIWLYGPFDPASSSVPAQPDWYLGWVEGSLRLLPSLEFEIMGREVPSPFVTGVLLPVAFFGLLILWPFLEGWVTGEREHRHVAQRPREAPVRTGLGAAGIAFLVILLGGGSQDLQALVVQVPVQTVTDFYRWLLVIVPPLVGVTAHQICRALLRSEQRRRGLPDQMVIDLGDGGPGSFPDRDRVTASAGEVP